MALLPEIAYLTKRINRTPSGCWEFSAVSGNGYGMVKVRNRSYLAHRFLYERCIDTIPAGMVLDHLCRNTRCCNPQHMEPVTHRENILRSPLIGAKTHCKHGHEFTPENTYVTPTGTRQCRCCRNDRLRSRQHRIQRERREEQ